MFKLLSKVLVVLCFMLAPGAWAGYSAIAYNTETGAWGEGHGASTLEKAENIALSYCGEGCSIVTWTYNACIALATNPLHGAGWTSARGQPTRDSAIMAALRNCVPNLNCTLTAWACN